MRIQTQDISLVMESNEPTNLGVVFGLSINRNVKILPIVDSFSLNLFVPFTIAIFKSNNVFFLLYIIFFFICTINTVWQILSTSIKKFSKLQIKCYVPISIIR